MSQATSSRFTLERRPVVHPAASGALRNDGSKRIGTRIHIGILSLLIMAMLPLSPTTHSQQPDVWIVAGPDGSGAALHSEADWESTMLGPLPEGTRLLVLGRLERVDGDS